MDPNSNRHATPRGLDPSTPEVGRRGEKDAECAPSSVPERCFEGRRRSLCIPMDRATSTEGDLLETKEPLTRESYSKVQRSSYPQKFPLSKATSIYTPATIPPRAVLAELYLIIHLIPSRIVRGVGGIRQDVQPSTGIFPLADQPNLWAFNSPRKGDLPGSKPPSPGSREDGRCPTHRMSPT